MIKTLNEATINLTNLGMYGPQSGISFPDGNGDYLIGGGGYTEETANALRELLNDQDVNIYLNDRLSICTSIDHDNPLFVKNLKAPVWAWLKADLNTLYPDPVYEMDTREAVGNILDVLRERIKKQKGD